jgi:hypothetical protein
MARHKSLRERFARLQPGGGGSRTKEQQTALGESVGDAETEGRFRADDCQVGSGGRGQVSQGFWFADVAGDCGNESGDARVSRDGNKV